MPAGTMSVARPTKWGNPWRVGDVIGSDIDEHPLYRGAGCVITPQLAVDLYAGALLGPRWHHHPRTHHTIMCGLEVTPADVYRELAGHDLACWCPLDQPCHADLLLRVAMGPL